MQVLMLTRTYSTQGVPKDGKAVKLEKPEITGILTQWIAQNIDAATSGTSRDIFEWLIFIWGTFTD